MMPMAPDPNEARTAKAHTKAGRTIVGLLLIHQRREFQGL